MEQNTSPQIPSTQKKKHRWRSLGIIGAILVVVAVFGYYLYGSHYWYFISFFRGGVHIHRQAGTAEDAALLERAEQMECPLDMFAGCLKAAQHLSEYRAKVQELERARRGYADVWYSARVDDEPLPVSYRTFKNPIAVPSEYRSANGEKKNLSDCRSLAGAGTRVITMSLEYNSVCGGLCGSGTILVRWMIFTQDGSLQCQAGGPVTSWSS